MAKIYCKVFVTQSQFVSTISLLCFFSWQDIVVGAPQYFEKDKEIGGAVYVYINKDGKWDEVRPIRIDGPQDSMFGLSVANLGDINQDGYDGETQYTLQRIHLLSNF